MSDIGRNDPCPCGSGKKYKKCCLIAAAVEQSKREAAIDESLAADLALGEQRVAELDVKRSKMTLSEAVNVANAFILNAHAP